MSNEQFVFDGNYGSLIQFDLEIEEEKKANVYVYDDGRDVYVELIAEQSYIEGLEDSFSSVTPLRKESPASIYMPIDNPPASVLVEAAEAAKDHLVGIGFKLINEKRSYVQL